MNRLALALGVVTMVTWGLWTVFAKLATRTLLPSTAIIVTNLVGVVVTAAYLVLSSDVATPTAEGLGYAAVAGLCLGLGALSFYAGLDTGEVSVITTMSGLYFVVAALFGVAFFGEALTVSKLLGVGFAVLAVVILVQ